MPAPDPSRTLSLELPFAPGERELVPALGRGRSKREASPEQEFGALYREHSRALLDYVYRRTRDPHVTEDLVADVFVQALHARSSYEERGVPVRHWLLRIATNRVHRWARSRRGTTNQELAEFEALEGSDAGQHGNRERVRRALFELPARDQAVLSLRYLEELSMQQVASVLGCREGTVRSRLTRARKKLKTLLERTK